MTMTGARLTASALAAALLASPALGADRVVALGGAATEIVYALDQEAVLVGVDQTSIYPPEAGSLPNVGYFRQVGAEGILSLSPDLVLAVDGAGPAQALAAIEGAGVVVADVHGDYTPDGIAQRIAVVAEALGVPEEGHRLADRVLTDFSALGEQLEGIENRPRIVSAISITDQSLNAAGGDTAANALITLAGGQNAISEYDGYQIIGAESLLVLAPDYLLLPSHTLAALGGVERLSEVTGLRLAGLDDPSRVIIVDTAFGLTFGPRQAAATAALAHYLHADLVPLPSSAEGLIGLAEDWAEDWAPAAP